MLWNTIRRYVVTFQCNIERRLDGFSAASLRRCSQSGVLLPNECLDCLGHGGAESRQQRLGGDRLQCLSDPVNLG
jgi:hypothetical protein